MPSKQEDELRKKIGDQLDGYAFAKVQDKETAIDEIMQLLTKDCNKRVREARITALTDVDNLNLLNDSDEWHRFYMDELATLKSQED